MKKVSVIIPNYNGERYVLDCLDSVLRQDYPAIEVIVIDDGSSDNSVKKIQSYIAKHNNDIKLICQSNLNAAIARNNGMNIATGDYVVFLDSDDLLEDNAIRFMVDVCERDGTDLVVGSYRKIKMNGITICDKGFTDKNRVVDSKKTFRNLVNIDPVPSNKLYKLSLAKENKLEWGNVRIGQDLNFYLKYLSFCGKVSIVKKNIYKYRISKNSMTRTYDSRIFDIINAFSDVEQFYKASGRESLYRRFIPFQALKHFNYQMGKMVYYRDRKVRDLIVRFFSINEKRLNYSSCVDDDGSLKKLRIRFRLKCALRFVLISRCYRFFKQKKGGGE